MGQRVAGEWRRLPAWSRVLVGVIIIFAVGRLILGATQSSAGADQEQVDAALAGMAKNVVFEVEGEERYSSDRWGMSVDVTITDPSGTQQGTGKDVPLGPSGGPPGLRRTLATGSPVSLTAQISSDDSGTVTCRITADGVVIVENTSSGGYAVVSCTGTV